MHKYFLKIPFWVRMIFSSYVWKVPVKDQSIFLTFDDGPHPEITPWVLAELQKYNAPATFFCIGKNVERFPETYQRVLAAGHSVGNHTYSHVNGWHTATAGYLQDVKKASAMIDSHLFRPPYGRIRKRQAKGLAGAIGKKNVKVVMWDVLSADFDHSIKPETCAGIVLKHMEPGSVIVFHDSEKAFPNLKHALPVVLEACKKRGFRFQRL